MFALNFKPVIMHVLNKSTKRKYIMNLQESFDYTVNKMVEQGTQCMDDDESCVYGNSEGQHCAVGWLLDHSNKLLMSHSGTVKSLIEEYADIVPEVIKENVECFNLIQTLHDFDGVETRRGIATKINELYSLDISNPNLEIWIKMGD